MDNREISEKLKLVGTLMELHDENPFKIRAYGIASFSIERIEIPISTLSQEAISDIQGVGKSIAQEVWKMIDENTFPLLEALKNKTPEGVMDMLQIKGLGPKKIRVFWKELDIKTPEELYTACEEGKIAALKGFGEKTQQSLLETLQYKNSQKKKLLFCDAEKTAQEMKDFLQHRLPSLKISFLGNLRRCGEVIECIELLINTTNWKGITEILASKYSINTKQSGPFSMRGTIIEKKIPFHIRLTEDSSFVKKLLEYTPEPAHLNYPFSDGKTVRELLFLNTKTEELAYQTAGLEFIPPELREGQFEFHLIRNGSLPHLITMEDIKGILHIHSHYSDGKNSLRTMAEYGKELGYEYLGITDHSQSAFYANGLDENRLQKQHEEIEALNKELYPFHIFKGIESDILPNGELDYEEHTLKTFDFVIASVHSSLNMDIEKATQRLITAIRNPYTTILGHPTGRILLERNGYPIDHAAVINACAEHNVIIEINSSPKRLDLDWRWVHYAMEKKVKLSINPDAHKKEGYADMYYGVLMGRKGGLTKNMTINTFSKNELQVFFKTRQVS
ncbi:MAG: helix-hairpin-helix domain-containing protein [Chitinophagaceae bacterium]|nr:helix-hairpin-helix domain-containing protein [Chitinophagaceae bacterium]